ncbi:Cytochrome c, mono- and diheme variant [Cesiribacter andamanensis AMV16]|uniref:Cytochrome c, mono-and diheme variant n=2 Tax=Cesiribacter TaxID=1133570 RepID=M7NKS7_9BACT|nr:Cytochrome c, mono- and diheme variant [Cesiribacter andamanensis AMV16]
MLAGFSGYAQELSGKKLFSGSCQACHSIGGGDIVGPDLAGISDRREADWIKGFITNSQKMITAGDEQAVAVFSKYNKIAMPSHNFSEEELSSLISYIDEASQEAQASAAQAAAEPVSPAKGTGQVQASVEDDMSIWVKLIFGGLGITIILLSTAAIYLIRILRN